MFGQVIIGPPGSGKSTYCHGMHQFFSAIGRKSAVVNLDPANDRLPYPCALDIRDFVALEDVMAKLNLGPNGALVYALEAFRQNGVDEFEAQVQQLVDSHSYLLFDCPGQVELFTHHSALFQIFQSIVRKCKLRLCVVSLIDSLYLMSAALYILVLLLSLRSMLHFDLPHVNVISKIDMLRSYGKLPMRLDFYTEALSLDQLMPLLESEEKSVLSAPYVRLTELIAELVEDFGLVGFEVLAVENKQSMINLLSMVDKANGYSFGSEVGGDTFWAEATRVNGVLGYAPVDIHERWIEYRQEYDEAEEKAMREAQEKMQGAPANNTSPALSAEDQEWELALRDWQEKRGGMDALAK